MRLTVSVRGQFLYRVSSGRIKAGRKTYREGDELQISLELAQSLASTGQLKFIRRLYDSKQARPLAPGEPFDRLGVQEMRRIKTEDVVEQARKHYGIINLKSRAKIIAEIKRIRSEIKKWHTAQSQICRNSCQTAC